MTSNTRLECGACPASVGCNPGAECFGAAEDPATGPTPTDADACLSFCASFKSTLDHASAYAGLYGAHDDPTYHGAYGYPSYVHGVYGKDNFMSAQCKVECAYADGVCDGYSQLPFLIRAEATRMCRYANALATGATPPNYVPERP